MFRFKFLLLNLFAMFVIVLSILLLFNFWAPLKNNIDTQVTKIYTKLAEGYDLEKGTYKDAGKATDLQSDVNSLQTDSVWIKFFQLLLHAIILVNISGLLASWLQSIYTHISFTRSEEERTKASVLSIALLSSTLIVLTAYVIVFTL